MTSKVNKHNQNGYEMCHAFGCRKHKKLISVYQGLFCETHYGYLSIIRNNLSKAKKLKIIECENFWLQQEIEFRKFYDDNHMKYKLYVENIVEKNN